jgi:hypothetical protein
VAFAEIRGARPVAVIMGARQCAENAMVASSPVTSPFTLLTSTTSIIDHTRAPIGRAGQYRPPSEHR